LFLACALISLLSQLMGNPVLQLDYYASLLMPSMFLAVGAQLAPLVKATSSRWFRTAICGSIAILLLTLRFPRPGSSWTARWEEQAPWFLLGILLVGGLLLLLKGKAPQTLALSLPILAVGLVNVTDGRVRATDLGVGLPAFRAIIKSSQAIRDMNPARESYFWYPRNEPQGTVYRAVASTYLWANRLINERFPSLEKDLDSFQSPLPNRRIVILTTDDRAFPEAVSSFRQIGLGAQLLSEHSIHEGPLGWKMLFVKLHGWPFLEEVRLTPDQWPDRLQVRWESQATQEVSVSRPDEHPLFQSDLNSDAEWRTNRYSPGGGLAIQTNCLGIGDSCGAYSSEDRRDHIATPMVELRDTGRTLVFFSIWVKPVAKSAMPKVVLQNERYDTLAEGTQLRTREDGWILLGALLEVHDAAQVRVTVTQPTHAVSLVDKMLITEIPALPDNSASAR
jgi:hypothetical protein